MSRKSKGINAERDLIHKFWNAEGWSAVRIAGSGSNRYPSADVLASNKLRKLAIECKTSKETSKYLANDEVGQLKIFAEIFGAEPWLAVKFNKEEWFFLSLEDIKQTEKGFVISINDAKNKGLLFEELIK
jgi:Holliday junction resolvase